MHYGGGGGTSVGGWHIPGGFDFGPHLVDGWWWVASKGKGCKAKVLSPVKHRLLQYCFAPFSKAGKQSVDSGGNASLIPTCSGQKPRNFRLILEIAQNSFCVIREFPPTVLELVQKFITNLRWTVRFAKLWCEQGTRRLKRKLV